MHLLHLEVNGHVCELQLVVEGIAAGNITAEPDQVVRVRKWATMLRCYDQKRNARRRKWLRQRRRYLRAQQKNEMIPLELGTGARVDVAQMVADGALQYEDQVDEDEEEEEDDQAAKEAKAAQAQAAQTNECLADEESSQLDNRTSIDWPGNEFTFEYFEGQVDALTGAASGWGTRYDTQGHRCTGQVRAAERGMPRVLTFVFCSLVSGRVSTRLCCDPVRDHITCVLR
jgi:hypothetical protein